MAIQLSKGQTDRSYQNKSRINKVIIGLGWDTNKYSGGNDFDLDASAFLVNAEGKVKTTRISFSITIEKPF